MTELERVMFESLWKIMERPELIKSKEDFCMICGEPMSREKRIELVKHIAHALATSLEVFDAFLEGVEIDLEAFLKDSVKIKIGKGLEITAVIDKEALANAKIIKRRGDGGGS